LGDDLFVGVGRSTSDEVRLALEKDLQAAAGVRHPWLLV